LDSRLKGSSLVSAFDHGKFNHLRSSNSTDVRPSEEARGGMMKQNDLIDVSGLPKVHGGFVAYNKQQSSHLKGWILQGYEPRFGVRYVRIFGALI
jgi:hypothetical protein